MLAVLGLHKRLGGQQVLAGLSLQVDTGERLAIMGDNGTGKTSLMKILASVLKADRGQFSLDGLGNPMAKAWRQQSAYVPQELMLDPELSVAENLAFWSAMSPLTRAQRRSQYAEAVAHPLVRDFLEKKVKDCSGGMQRRAHMLAGLMGGRRLLLFDEPFTGADLQSQALMMEAMRRLSSEGSILVFTSHQADLAEALATRVLRLAEGRLQ